MVNPIKIPLTFTKGFLLAMFDWPEGPCLFFGLAPPRSSGLQGSGPELLEDGQVFATRPKDR